MTSGLTCFRCNPSTRRLYSCNQEAAARLTQATAGTRMRIFATSLARLRRRLKRNKMSGVHVFFSLTRHVNKAAHVSSGPFVVPSCLSQMRTEPLAATYSSENDGLVFIKLADVRCSRDERVRVCFRCCAATAAAMHFRPEAICTGGVGRSADSKCAVAMQENSELIENHSQGVQICFT